MSSKSSVARPFQKPVQGCITGAAIVLVLLLVQTLVLAHIAYASTKSVADAKVSTISVRAFTGKEIKAQGQG